MTNKQRFISFLYTKIAKPIFFKIDPEKIHNIFLDAGRIMGKCRVMKKITSLLFNYKNEKLEQEYFGIKFRNPVGLSAGFDYNADLTTLLGDVGFGFESMGTVTNKYYEGNKKPRLGRLPKSKSLLVNKGFKSLGIEEVLNNRVKFKDEDFQVGISIGATNSPETSEACTQIEDIINSFNFLVNHKHADKFAFYELNISCPNVVGSGTLAEPEPLKEILTKIREINFDKPLFVKFQLEIEWELAKELVQIMIDHKVDAVIISNLLKKKDNFDFVKEEIDNITNNNLKGNFSGKCTEDLSNDLISKVYSEFGDRVKIIGVGGIFSAEDAYEKIKRGASLVELITGMIYEGPQVIGSINAGLVEMLEKDGYSNISEAIGAYHE